MPEIGTSGLMSGVGNRDGPETGQHPRPTSTLPVISEAGDQAADAIASGFARSLYPVLRGALPQ